MHVMSSVSKSTPRELFGRHVVPCDELRRLAMLEWWHEGSKMMRTMFGLCFRLCGSAEMEGLVLREWEWWEGCVVATHIPLPQ